MKVGSRSLSLDATAHSEKQRNAERSKKKRQKKETQDESLRRLHLVFLVFGVTAKLVGIGLLIVTLVIHGGKFDKNSMTAVDNTRLDGPGIDFLVTLYVLGSIALFVLATGVAGPCAVQRRWNFAGQTVGLLVDASTAIVTKAVCDRWPSNATGWSPNKFLTAASLLMLCSSGVMLYTAFWLSGTGWHPLPKKATKYIRVSSTGDDGGIDVTETDVLIDEEAQL